MQLRGKLIKYLPNMFFFSTYVSVILFKIHAKNVFFLFFMCERSHGRLPLPKWREGGSGRKKRVVEREPGGAKGSRGKRAGS